MRNAELDRRIAALAIPALGSIAAEPLYNLADTAIVGHLGRTPLGSLAIANAALILTSWVAIFLSTATTSTVAGRRAANQHDQAARAAGAAYVTAVAGGVLVALLVIVAAPAAARLLAGGADNSKTVQGAIDYLRISALGVPFLYLSYAGNGHLVGLADTRSPLRIAVGANVLNVALEVALVYGVTLGASTASCPGHGHRAGAGAASGRYFYTSRRAVDQRRAGPAEHERSPSTLLLRAWLGQVVECGRSRSGVEVAADHDRVIAARLSPGRARRPADRHAGVVLLVADHVSTRRSSPCPLRST